jgi:hypothetical protein
MIERPKTPLEQANEMLLKDHPAERLKKIEGETRGHLTRRIFMYAKACRRRFWVFGGVEIHL